MGLQDREYMSDAKASKKNHFDKKKWESAFREAERKTEEIRKVKVKPPVRDSLVYKKTEYKKEEKKKILNIEQKIKNIEFWQWLLIWAAVVAIFGVIEKQMRVI